MTRERGFMTAFLVFWAKMRQIETDRLKVTIILEPTEALTSNNAFLLKDAGHSGRLIYANPFCKHFGIRIKGTLKFIAPTTDSRNRLYLKLNETITVTRGPRGPRKAG